MMLELTAPALAPRILLVEDNAADARLVWELLKLGDVLPGTVHSQPATLTHVVRLQEAVDRLAVMAIDIVLLDLSLPDAEGLEAITRMHAVAPEIPIVVMSASYDQSLALSGVQAGAQDYLVKGRVDGDALARAIRYAIARKHDERERSHQARALWVSEQRLATIVTNAPLILFTVDREGWFTLATGQGLEALGAWPGSWVGRSVFDLSPDLAEMHDYVRRALAGEACIGSIELASSHFEIWYGPEYDAWGDVVGVIGVAMNVTERVESEHRFRSLVEVTPVGACIVDEHGIYETVNAAYAALYGYSREELLGRHIGIVVPRPEQVSLLAPMGYAGEHEYETVTKLGLPLTVLVRTVRIAGSDGRPRYATFALDVTARARALREAERAQATAEDLARLRSDFVAAVSHELRTPITAIIGFGELLEIHWAKSDDRQRLDRVGKIMRSAYRLHRMVEDLLLLSRLGAGKVQVRSELVSLLLVTRHAAEEVQASYPDVLIDLAGQEDCRVLADADRMLQVLVILLDNAAKYAPVGSPIDVSWQVQNTMLAIQVRDHGPGIPVEGREHLFTRFGRVPGTPARAGRVGTGLGLYLGRQLAQAMGGSLDLEATGPEGASFCLRLPLAEQPEYGVIALVHSRLRERAMLP
jgi:PAS domain S-box-containing protein